MTPNKSYLIRAIYDWIVDNKLTPYIVVDANMSGVDVPRECIEAGRIVLNISPSACQGLHLNNDRIVFSARFDKGTMQIALPPTAVLAIYARENKRGMVFTKENTYEGDDGDGGDPPASPPTSSSGSTSRKRGRANLTVVK